MKTEVIIVRNPMNLPIEQSSATGMFNATKLLNAAISTDLKPSKTKMADYWELNGSSDLKEQIMFQEGLTENEVARARTGRYGGTWLHPIQFIDFMMWLSPTFKYQALKMVHDKLIEFRNTSGDTFKEMNAALTKAYPETFNGEKWQNYSRVASSIATACCAPTGKDKWNIAPEWCLMLRNEIQSNVILLAGVIDKPGECLKIAVEKAYLKHGTPQVLMALDSL